MASGDSLITFDPRCYLPPLTLPRAALNLRTDRPVLAFDAAVVERAYVTGVMPRHYSGGGITARLMWTAATATTGSVQWSLALERHAPTFDLDGESFGTTGSVTATTNVVSGAPAYTDLALAAAALGGLLAGEHFRLVLARAADAGMVGDAQLYSVELRET